MNPYGKSGWQRRATLGAFLLAAFVGFFLVGRSIGDDQLAASPAPAEEVAPAEAVRPPPPLTLAGRIPRLVEDRPPKEANQRSDPAEKPPEPAPEPAPEEPAEPPPATETVPTTTPPPVPPPEPAPQPEPEPAPQPDPPSPPPTFEDTG